MIPGHDVFQMELMEFISGFRVIGSGTCVLQNGTIFLNFVRTRRQGMPQGTICSCKTTLDAVIELVSGEYSKTTKKRVLKFVNRQRFNKNEYVVSLRENLLKSLVLGGHPSDVA